MRFLKSCAIKIVLIILLHFVKAYAEQATFVSAPYLRTIVNTIQLFVLFNVLVCALIFLVKRNAGWEKWGVLITGGAFVIGELIVMNSFTTTKYHGLHADLSRTLYFQYEAGRIATSDKVIVYDRDLFYRLAPSTQFDFNSREYKTEIHTNKAGLRDTDSNLVAPEIIFLGDSYTMGWGLNQRELYTSLVGKQLGKKTLNAGVLSYGTPRALTLLRQLDTSALKYLVIQYCDNDQSENQAFVDNNKLVISDSAAYRHLLDSRRWQATYFPGSYFAFACKEIIDHWRGKSMLSVEHYTDREDKRKNADTFMEVLARSSLAIDKYTVLVFNASPYVTGKDPFIGRCREIAANSANDSPFKDIVFLDVAANMQLSDYYSLDTHYKPQGSNKVAEQLAVTIRVIDSLHAKFPK